jgi:hypothetical protein
MLAGVKLIMLMVVFSLTFRDLLCTFLQVGSG